MISSENIKELILEAGACICSISSVDRFEKSPKGFHLKDIYNDTKSVIVYGISLNGNSMNANNCISYTFMNNQAAQKVDLIGFESSNKLTEMKINNVVIPSWRSTCILG